MRLEKMADARQDARQAGQDARQAGQDARPAIRIPDYNAAESPTRGSHARLRITVVQQSVLRRHRRTLGSRAESPSFPLVRVTR